MLERTIFKTEEEIKNIIKEKYGINITKVTKLNRGSANIYELNNRKYILKEFQSICSKKDIDKETIIIEHLKNKGIKVPKYIKSLNNEYSFVYKNRIIVLEDYIEGNTIKQNSGNYKQTIESAKNLGLIINALEDCPYEFNKCNISNLYNIEDLNSSIKKYQDIITQLNENNKTDLIIKKDIIDKIEMIKNIITKFKFKELKKLTYKNTHGDYNMMQFIYKDGNINAIIDFVSAEKMPIVWEIIRSYSYIDEKAKDGVFNLENLVDYVNEFCNYVKLNKYDLKYMSYIYLIQLLNSTYGYRQYLEDRKNKDLLKFGIFRTKICRYLYKNADKISNILIKNCKYTKE